MYSTDIEIVRSVVRGGGLKTRSRLYRSTQYEARQKTAPYGSSSGKAGQNISVRKTHFNMSW